MTATQPDARPAPAVPDVDGGTAEDEAAHQTPDENTDAATEENTDADGTAPNREAAKYRTRLREVEAERDALRDRLDAVDRARAEAMAAEGGTRLHKGTDLWLGGASLEDVRDEAGELDPAKVDLIRDALLAERPYLRQSKWGGSGIDQGVRGTGGKPRSEPRMGAIFERA